MPITVPIPISNNVLVPIGHSAIPTFPLILRILAPIKAPARGAAGIPVFRVGHLGYINDRDIISVISAISNTLLDLGKVTAQQAGEALVVVSRYLEGN